MKKVLMIFFIMLSLISSNIKGNQTPGLPSIPEAQKDRIPKGQGTLIVVIDNLRNSKGVVRAAIFKSEKDYQDSGHTAVGAFKLEAIKIENNVATWVLKDIPYGEYAIKLYHDEDNSGKIKTNMIGIPKEDIGFSNNPSLVHGLPSFESTKFVLDSKEKKIEIKVYNL